MKKYFPLFWVFYLLCAFSAHAGEGRYTIPLTGGGWSLWLDKEASWQNDRLYLPHEITDLSLLPVNVPTGGWQTLSHNPDAVLSRYRVRWKNISLLLIILVRRTFGE